jgi:hypothetical protein
MAQCPNCGAGLVPGAPRCVKCGSIVPEKEPPPPAEPHPGGKPVGKEDLGGVNVNVNIDGNAKRDRDRRDYDDDYDDYDDYDDDYDDDWDDGYDLKPHRGGAIMAWAIIGWFICAILGPLIAISMANTDLKEMNQGIKDPSGRGTVTAGKTIAIIALVLQILGIGFTIFAAAMEGGFR